MVFIVTGRNSRTFVAKKRDVGNHGVVPLGMATGQGGGLGHGRYQIYRISRGG